MGGEHGLPGCVLPLPACLQISHAVTAGQGIFIVSVFWTSGHFLCIIIVVICSLRLFIEKLPKHRDYKSAVIPEKKDMVKVGLHLQCCASKSFKEAQTNFKVKVVGSPSVHQVL